jgi:hypothetical protein
MCGSTTYPAVDVRRDVALGLLDIVRHFGCLGVRDEAPVVPSHLLERVRAHHLCVCVCVCVCVLCVCVCVLCVCCVCVCVLCVCCVCVCVCVCVPELALSPRQHIATTALNHTRQAGEDALTVRWSGAADTVA